MRFIYIYKIAVCLFNWVTSSNCCFFLLPFNKYFILSELLSHFAEVRTAELITIRPLLQRDNKELSGPYAACNLWKCFALSKLISAGIMVETRSTILLSPSSQLKPKFMRHPMPISYHLNP